MIPLKYLPSSSVNSAIAVCRGMSQVRQESIHTSRKGDPIGLWPTTIVGRPPCSFGPQRYDKALTAHRAERPPRAWRVSDPPSQVGTPSLVFATSVAPSAVLVIPTRSNVVGPCSQNFSLDRLQAERLLPPLEGLCYHASTEAMAADGCQARWRLSGLQGVHRQWLERLSLSFPLAQLLDPLGLRRLRYPQCEEERPCDSCVSLAMYIYIYTDIYTYIHIHIDRDFHLHTCLFRFRAT